MTLTEFLTARLDEDEAVVRASVKMTVHGGHSFTEDHRPLREVEAKRAIVALAILPDHQTWTSPWVDALAALAAVYSDHPDYRDAWRELTS